MLYSTFKQQKDNSAIHCSLNIKQPLPPPKKKKKNAQASGPGQRSVSHPWPIGGNLTRSFLKNMIHALFFSQDKLMNYHRYAGGLQVMFIDVNKGTGVYTERHIFIF